MYHSQMCTLGGNCGDNITSCIQCQNNLGNNTLCHDITYKCCILDDIIGDTKCINDNDCCNVPFSVCLDDGMCSSCMPSGILFVFVYIFNTYIAVYYLFFNIYVSI